MTVMDHREEGERQSGTEPRLEIEAGSALTDPARAVAALHHSGAKLDLKTIDLCFLAALYARENDTAQSWIETDAGWELANPSRISTGESIGIGGGAHDGGAHRVGARCKPFQGPARTRHAANSFFSTRRTGWTGRTSACSSTFVSPSSHSKATLTGTRRGALEGVALTRDGTVRLRPNAGLVLRAGAIEIEASRVAAVTGEVVLTERALLDGTTLAGTPPAAVLLVENLGPFVDMAVPDGWMAVHVPGWNTSTARRLLDGIDASIPVVHFGDLDPEGVQIGNHLRARFPRLRWAVPDFWRECVPDRAQKGEWPTELNLGAAHALVHELRDAGLWLEQETIGLDPRLPEALEEALGDEGRHGSGTQPLSPPRSIHG